MRRHIGFYDVDERPNLLRDLDDVARRHNTSRSQVLRAAIEAGLPLLRRGEAPVPPPRPTGRPAHTPARKD